MHDVGAQQPERGERARPRRHQDAPHAELLRDRGGVHGAGAAERQQREGREIDAALGREHAHLVGHAHVDDALDADGGRRARPSSSGSATCSCSAAVRRRDVERLRAAEEVVGIEIAADDVGVGDGRPRAAAAVAGRAGIGAGALRARR